MTDPTPTPTRAEVEAAVEKLANSHLGMSLEEWNAVSNTILTCAAENQALRERAEAAEAEATRLEMACFNQGVSISHTQAALTAARRAETVAWNDAIEAAASVYLNGANPNTWDYFSLARHEIRALRRSAPTEGEA